MNEENGAKSSEASGRDESQMHEREEVYTKVVRAGNRTYFFDVKATRKNDLYLTITESKKRFNKDGKFFYEKHKVFLYKEDFEKFANGFEDAVTFIKNNLPEQEDEPTNKESSEKGISNELNNEFINVEFEDLGDK